MNTKLLLQIPLTLGCLGFVVAVLEALTQSRWIAAPERWWRGAVGCWTLIVAIRIAYPARAK